MAFRPNKDIKPPVIPAREAAKGATLARTDDDALKAPPRTDGATTGKNGEGSSFDVFNAPAAGPAAGAAAAVKGAVEQRLSDAKTGPSEEDHSGTIEASTEISDRLNESLADMLDRAAGDDVLGLGSSAGEQEDGSDASRDSGKGNLQGLVDEAFAAEATGGGAGGLGRIGTPEDLGVTGAIGAKGDLGGGSGTGLDVFNVNLSTLGASGVANDLAVMQGVASGSDPDPGAGPSVADDESGGVALLKQAIQEANAEAAARSSESTGSGSTGSTAPSTTPAGSTPKGDGNSGQGSSQSGEQPSTVTRALEWLSQAIYDRPLMGEAGGGGTGGQGNVNTAEQMKLVDDGLGAKPEDSTTIGQALKGQGVNNLETAVSQALGSGKKGPGKTQDPGAEGSDVKGLPTPEYLAWRAAARERLGLGHGGSGDIDPADNGEAGPGGPPLTVAEAGLQQKAVREFLIGQPAGPAAGTHGGGSIDSGRLPGDMGNIDFGPDSTGAWTGNTQTESESEALDSLGGSGLTIEDAHRNDDEEDEEEDSDDAS
jgi:hypothetical protein